MRLNAAYVDRLSPAFDLNLASMKIARIGIGHMGNGHVHVYLLNLNLALYDEWAAVYMLPALHSKSRAHTIMYSRTNKVVSTDQGHDPTRYEVGKINIYSERAVVISRL